MKRFLVFALLMFLVACMPNQELNIQETISSGIVSTQTELAKSIPTLTPTPEFCPSPSTTNSMKEIKDLYDQMFSQHSTGVKNLIGFVDPLLKVTSELGIILEKIDRLEVPLCLTNLKGLLQETSQSSLDIFTHHISGNATARDEAFTSFRLNLEAYEREYERIENCLPNCVP
jgi:hypothetical protein